MPLLAGTMPFLTAPWPFFFQSFFRIKQKVYVTKYLLKNILIFNSLAWLKSLNSRQHVSIIFLIVWYNESVLKLSFCDKKVHVICMLSVDPVVQRMMKYIFLSTFKDIDCFVRLKDKLLSEAVEASILKSHIQILGKFQEEQCHRIWWLSFTILGFLFQSSGNVSYVELEDENTDAIRRQMWKLYDRL